jgi:site-specific DNA-methyltransferase (adenine-specific)
MFPLLRPPPRWYPHPVPDNTLYYGDNLDILRRYVADESVDLVYLDPPFNSNANYNVLFKEHSGEQAASQIRAFEDTWTWSMEAELALESMIVEGGQVSVAMQALRKLLGTSNMMAYLAMMAPRLVELRRALKPTGSIYLHCDPTASHYLKLLMDAVFDPRNFRNEVVWQRTAAKGDARRKLGSVHDVLLSYSKTPEATFRPVFRERDDAYEARFKYDDGDGRGPYRLAPLDSPNPRPNLTYEYKGYSPPAKGWRVSLPVMEQLDRDDRLWFPKDKNGRIARKHYSLEQEGPKVADVWTDIPPLQASSAERLGYPTQKPLALLERIVQTSSNEGDVVLDPFCGCGTAIDAAQKLGRRWIGIDVTYLAIALIRRRLRDAYGESIDESYEVIGEPASVSDAKVLAAADPYQFQWWALDQVHARGTEQKKGADKGIDGRIYFHEGDSSDVKQIIISVKAGHTGRAHVHELRGVVDREEAVIGVLITMQETTKPMRDEAATAGFYTSPWGKHPRLQLLTVEDLLGGKGIDCPPLRHTSQTFKRAPKAAVRADSASLFDEAHE